MCYKGVCDTPEANGGFQGGCHKPGFTAQSAREAVVLVNNGAFASALDHLLPMAC